MVQRIMNAQQEAKIKNCRSGTLIWIGTGVGVAIGAAIGAATSSTAPSMAWGAGIGAVLGGILTFMKPRNR